MKHRKLVRRLQHQPDRRKGRRRFLLIVSTCLIAALCLVTLAGPWRMVGGRKFHSLSSAPPPPVPPPSNPSKEYIYAGDRLIATEEASLLAAPVNLVAATYSAVEIDLTWTAVPNAHHYQVERASNLGGTFVVLDANVLGPSFNDRSVTSVNAYLYRVRAADSAGNLSPTSNVDLATAIGFEDDPVSDQTLIRAQHIVQLRQAINAARAMANLAAATWTQPSLTLAGQRISAIDVEELGTALDPALAAIGLPTGGYTDTSLTGKYVQTIHINELRQRVK
jgi:hypothetical protein